MEAKRKRMNRSRGTLTEGTNERTNAAAAVIRIQSAKILLAGKAAAAAAATCAESKRSPISVTGQTDSLPAIQLMTEQVGGSEEHGRRRPRAREMGSSVLNHFQYRYRILQPFEGDRQTPRAQRPLALSPPPRNFRVPSLTRPQR